MDISGYSAGIILYENCHKTKYVRKQGLKKISDYDNDAIHHLEIRAGHIFTPEIDTISLHHEQVYISKYFSWQLACCDPWQLHNKKNSKQIP